MAEFGLVLAALGLGYFGVLATSGYIEMQNKRDQMRLIEKGVEKGLVDEEEFEEIIRG